MPLIPIFGELSLWLLQGVQERQSQRVTQIRKLTRVLRGSRLTHTRGGAHVDARDGRAWRGQHTPACSSTAATMHGQTRARGGGAARPLLSFTAQDAPLPHLTRVRTPAQPAPRRRSRLVTVVYLLPLVFVFALLAFASYTFLYTLCYVRSPPSLPIAGGQVE